MSCTHTVRQTDNETVLVMQASTYGSLDVAKQTQQRHSLAPTTSDVESPRISSSGQLKPLDSDEANSCRPDQDLGESHSTAEKQVMALSQAPHAPKAAASSTPATTASSQVWYLNLFIP